MKMNMAAFPGAILLATILLSGCSHELPLQADLETGAASQAVLIGNDQQTVAGTELPQPVTVKVMDAAGNPVSKQIVNFVVTRGGGDTYAGAAVTNEDGLARDWWTLGPVPGANELEVRAVDSTTGEPIVFGKFVATGL